MNIYTKIYALILGIAIVAIALVGLVMAIGCKPTYVFVHVDRKIPGDIWSNYDIVDGCQVYSVNKEQYAVMVIGHTYEIQYHNYYGDETGDTISVDRIVKEIIR